MAKTPSRFLSILMSKIGVGLKIFNLNEPTHKKTDNLEKNTFLEIPQSSSFSHRLIRKETNSKSVEYLDFIIRLIQCFSTGVPRSVL